MAIFHVYFASCALLLALSCRGSTGLPVPGPTSPGKCAACPPLFRSLLLNIRGLLKDDDLCYAITSDAMVVKSKTDTVLACAPTLTQNSSCMMQSNSTFNESECMGNIMKDLAHYAAAIQSYINLTLRRPEVEVALLRSTLGIIQNLRKNCSLIPDGEKESSEEDVAQMWGNDTFSNRQEMCKMIKGFYTRTITINRAMGYISSGDYKKFT